MPLDTHGLITGMTLLLIIEIGVMASILEWRLRKEVRRMEGKIDTLLKVASAIGECASELGEVSI